MALSLGACGGKKAQKPRTTSANPEKFQDIAFENEIGTAKAEIGENADNVDA